MEVKAPTGTKLNCKSWQTEAPLRMLMNNLDKEVAKDPDNLIVYGGTGKAVRNWECYEKIIACLKNLNEDETLVVQSGKPVAVFRTNEWSPRVIISNAMLVPKWATWENFWELERKGLTMYGQMTAGSWIYIGTQGILQGTYETLSSLAKKHFNGDLKRKFVLTSGLGEMGGAQPLAITMNGGVCLAIEVDKNAIERRLRTGYLDMFVEELDTALELVETAKENKKELSVGLLGNSAEILPKILKRNIVPDVLTDQTSAHDILNGYVPHGISYENALKLRKENPEQYKKMAMKSIAVHVRAMLEFQKRGSIVFDYGNNIREQAFKGGVKNAFDIQGFVPLFIRPLFCEGKGPFRWVALSGDEEDIYKTDKAILETFSEDESLRRWITKAREKVKFQGLPARICWLGYGERARFGKVINDMVRKKELIAPIVIGRDHLDCGSVASPFRETEGMKDGSDVIADWPILNALLNTCSGATWVSVHHGGGVGIGYSIHAGMVIVADGTEMAEKKLQRVLTVDSGLGVVRHADAGYEIAKEVAKKRGIKMVMVK